MMLTGKRAEGEERRRKARGKDVSNRKRYVRMTLGLVRKSPPAESVQLE